MTDTGGRPVGVLRAVSGLPEVWKRCESVCHEEELGTVLRRGRL